MFEIWIISISGIIVYFIIGLVACSVMFHSSFGGLPSFTFVDLLIWPVSLGYGIFKGLPKWAQQFIQFAIIGGIGVFINLGITWGLTEYAAVHYMVSNFIGICVAMTCNFIGNKFWTFKGA
jgi:hypothetical protein